MNFLRRIKASLGADTAYLGASRSAREVTGWDAGNSSADAGIEEGLETLTSRARDLDRNSGLAQNLKNTKIENIIGVGLQWQPQPNWKVLGKTSDWAHEFAAVAKPHWNDFAKSRHFDYEGEDNFAMQSRLLYSNRFTNGAGCVVPMWLENRPGTRYRTCFKVVESDRLSNPAKYVDINQSRISNGVERDRNGQIIRYHIRNTHPGESNVGVEGVTWEPIPAYYDNGRRGFIHVYHKDRPGQSRGVAAVSAVMAAFGIRSKYQLTELQAADVASRIAGVMETPLSDEQAQKLFGGKSSDFSELRKTWNGKLTSGMILKLPPGTKYQTHIPNRPATAYVGFMDHISQEIGIAVGLPDILSRRDWSKVNYSSARGALLECWRGFYVEQSEICFQAFTPMVELWMEDAIDLGVFDDLLTLDEFYAHRSACTNGRWLGKGNQPIDRLKHENANKIALENGTTTLMDIFAEDGEDAEEKIEQSFREKAAALRNKYRMAALEKELKVEFEVELAPEPPAPPKPEEPPPLSDEEIDKNDEEDNETNEPEEAELVE